MAATRGWRTTLSSLQIPNYRWYWFSATFAAAAMNMQLFARGWYMYELTDSPLALGWVSFGAGLPLLLLSPFAGVFVERWEKRDLMIVTQFLTTLMLLSVAVLITTDTIVWWHLVIASVVNGIILAFNIPSRQSIVPQLVGHQQVMNAVALSSGTENLNRVLAPALGGVLIAAIDIDGVYFLMVALSIVATSLLFSVPRVGKRTPDALATVRSEISDGLSYVRHSPALRELLVMAFVPILFGMPYMMLLPLFAKDVLEVGVDGLGLLAAAAGIGALFASVTLASMGNFRRKGALLLICATLFGVFLVLFASSNTFYLSVLLLVVIGMTHSSYMSVNNTLLLLNSEEKMRGRVMSLYMTNIAIFPIAVLPITAAIELLDAPLVVGVGGAILVAFSLGMAIFARTLRKL
ncbi:MAG: MFS transporter [Chloroflexi bacterium]|jgi:MFS family permease|nr:MFS transporter [Chloroflexota bacterium]